MFSYYAKPVSRFLNDVADGAAPLTVQFQDLSSGTVNSRLWIFGDGTTDTAAVPRKVYTTAGDYEVSLVVTGPGGSDSSGGVHIIVIDTTRPMQVTNLSAMVLNCSTAVVTWSASESADLDILQIVGSRNGYPQVPGAGEYIRTADPHALSDTLKGLPSDGYTLYISVFVKNNAGNWSLFAEGSYCSILMPNGNAPENTGSLSLQNRSDTAVVISWTVKTGAEKVQSVRIGFSKSKSAAIDSSKVYTAKDSSIEKETVQQGWWFGAVAVIDLTGNQSVFTIDSVYIANSDPVLIVPSDTSIVEDFLWEATLRIVDSNLDTIDVEIVEGPQGVHLSGYKLQWMPDDRDIGTHRLIIKATDRHEGFAQDTIWLTVIDNKEPPVITLCGSTTAFEDSLYVALLCISDPDPLETHTITLQKAPTWIQVHGDTLLGTPGNDDVGSNLIEIRVTDKYGLEDTLRFTLVVENRNDQPEITTSTIPDTLYENQTCEAYLKVYDPDRGDSIVAVSESGAWLKVQSWKRDSVPGYWRVMLSMTPVQRDTGMQSVRVRITDLQGATVIYVESVRIIDTNDPPGRPTISRKVVTGAVQYMAQAKDDRDTLLTYKGKLVSVEDTGRIWNNSSSSGLFNFYPLADGIYLFRVEASDQEGQTGPAAWDTLKIRGATTCVLTDTGWTMISIPAGSLNRDYLKATNYLLHWDETIQEKQLFFYYRQKEEIGNLEKGKAYWRKGGNDTISLATSALLTDPIQITLTKKTTGWNQIASPYPYPVRWPNPDQVLWVWNPVVKDYEESYGILEPWKGYWVQTDTIKKVNLGTTPVFTLQPLSKRMKTFFTDKETWNFQVALTSTSGQDHENYFGFNKDAVDGFGPEDLTEPPRPAGYASLSFVRSDWKSSARELACEMRRQFKSVNVFEFTLSGSSEGEKGTLLFRGLEQARGIYFFMVSNDTILPLESGKEYPVILGSEKTYRSIFVTENRDFFHSVPLAFRVGNPYPNPFCPGTKIQYALPYRFTESGKINVNPYKVKISIFDSMGRIIRVILHRKQDPGTYLISWDGKGAHGRIISSGNYYLTVQADEFKSVKQVIMLK